jgi:hypothetical protein
MPQAAKAAHGYSMKSITMNPTKPTVVRIARTVLAWTDRAVFTVASNY